jgi:hypothetical protein
MQGMQTDDSHKQFGKRNLTPLGMCTVGSYCGVKCFTLGVRTYRTYRKLSNTGS